MPFDAPHLYDMVESLLDDSADDTDWVAGEWEGSGTPSVGMAFKGINKTPTF